MANKSKKVAKEEKAVFKIFDITFHSITPVEEFVKKLEEIKDNGTSD